MKKILFIAALFGSLFASAQIPGYTFVNEKIERNDNIFRALGLPSGDSAQFRVGQARRQSAIYWDSTDNNTPKGLYVWDGTVWILQGQPTSIPLPDGVLFGGSVTPEGGFQFAIQEAIYRIGNMPYTSDSGTVIVDSADATYDRFDAIYLGTDGDFHVLKGIPAENPTIPQLQGDQLLLTVVSIEAGATAANVSSVNVYFENDATITPSGTTAVGNATTAPFAGTYHIRITTINNGDYVDIVKTSGTWDVSNRGFLSIHIKNRAQVPQLANLRVSMWNGATTGSQVSGEVIINYNKNNITTYQAISIPWAAFGTITNNNIDRIRLRFTSNNATNFTGYDIDNVSFGAGISQPGGGGGNATFTLNMPAAFNVGPSTTAQSGGTWNVTAIGTTSQYIRGDGSLATFNAVTGVGTVNSGTKSSNGGAVSGSNLILQDVDATYRGLVTPTMKQSWDSSYTVENLSSLGDSIMRPIDALRTGFKSLVAGANVTLTDTDSTIVIASSGGGGGGGRFGYSGEDDAAGETRSFNVGSENFSISGNGTGSIALETNDGGDNQQYVRFNDAQNLEIGGTYLAGSIYTRYSSDGVIRQHSDAGLYQFDDVPDSSAAGTHYMLTWNATNDRMYKMALPTGGGGGSYTTEEAQDAAAALFTPDDGDIDYTYNDGTPSITSTIKSNAITNAKVNDVAYSKLTSVPNAAADGTTKGVSSFTAADFDASSGNIAIDYTNGQAASGSNKGFLTSTDWTTFNGKQSTLTNSAGLLAALSDETGTGLAVFGTTPTITTPVFSGAVSTTAATQNGTNASGTGGIPYIHKILVRSDETLVNTTADQNLFTNTVHDVITVQANTTYEFELEFDLTHSATSHSVSFGLTPATATFSSISYSAWSQVSAVGTGATTQTTYRYKTNAISAVTAAGANATETITIKGTFTIGTGGTVTPQIKFSVDPGGTILLKAGAKLNIWAIGNDTFTEQGPIN